MDVKLFFYRQGSEQIFLQGTRVDDQLVLTSLVATGITGGQTETFLLFTDDQAHANELRVPVSLTKETEPGSGEFIFVPNPDAPILTADLLFEANKNSFFGRQFDVETGVRLRLSVQLPVSANVISEIPFATIEACGRAAIKTDPSFVFAAERFCYRLVIDQIPATLASTQRPLLDFGLPEVGFQFPRTRLRLDLFSLPAPSLRLPSFSSNLNGLPVSIKWASIQVDADETRVAIDIRGFRIDGKIGAIEGDVHLVVQSGQINLDQSYFGLYHPDFRNVLRLAFSQWSFDDNCVWFQWDKGRVNEWLRLVVPDLVEQQELNAEMAFQFVFDGASLSEARLDWRTRGANKTLHLPGFDVAVPSPEFCSLLFRDDEHQNRHLTFLLTLAENTKIVASANLLFGRSGQEQRELHNNADDNSSLKNESLISFEVATNKPISVAVMDIPLESGPVTFFRQLEQPLESIFALVDPLDFVPPEELVSEDEPVSGFKLPTAACTPSHAALVSLLSDDWSGTLNFPMGKEFNLPFLKIGDQQFLTIKRKGAPLKLDFDKKQVHCDLLVSLHLGSATELTAEVQLAFDWETFAFSIDDGDGLTFSVKDQIPPQDFLGLTWTFVANDKKELFKLVTADSNYQIKQAPQSRIEAAFTRATSKEQPIVFSLTDFVITAGGVSVNARVTDSPARLNGINEQFRFTEGSFQIRDNNLTDFTLSGSGPLPPALVGTATASISLQFGQRNGRLELIAGAAQLRGTKLLKCQGTRFQFSVDGIGLKFVNDGRYHLYFTLTGMARFVPVPSDDSSGPLAWLPTIELQLIECPLAGDARVISKHIRFLVELPKKKTFDFLGCFKMELRGIGFVPQAAMFDEDASAMELSGQLKFAEGDGDVLDARIDFHSLFIGLPAPGHLAPRIHLKDLGIKIKSGDAFELEGVVDFLDGEIEPGITAKGFSGEGTVTIQGLPTIAASFSFIRASRDGGNTWVKAWFLYIEARKLSLMIPVIQIYIREVGFGFGYRYTLASIKVADELDDPRKLIQELTRLSRTQGQLAHRDQWRVDIEEDGHDARWTVALRAMISQTTAAGGPTDWNAALEKDLSSLFVMDVVIGLRSDLTFLMTGRAWLNTNYNDYLTDAKGLQSKPLMSGFLLLSPRRKRLLAHFASNQGAEFGDHPPLPSFLKEAIRQSQFSATLLIEPGLLHYELGWPNMLRWRAKLGPLDAEFRGGTIFRVSRTELVIGNSFLARGSLQLSAQLNLGFVGARLSATANVAYGARYIGVIGFVSPASRSALYGAVGVEINVQVQIDFWLKIELTFVTIRLDFHFSFSINFTAFLEVGVTFGDFIGARGTATVCLGIMGHDLRFGIHVGINENAVEAARRITEQYLHIGLEATEVEPIPGSTPASLLPNAPPAQPILLANAAADAGGGGDLDELVAELNPPQPAADTDPELAVPNYSILSIPFGPDKKNRYFILLPSGRTDDNQPKPERGFLPVSPDGKSVVQQDFIWNGIPTIDGIKHFDPTTRAFRPVKMSEAWNVDWKKEIGDGDYVDGKTGAGIEKKAEDKRIKLGSLLLNAFVTRAKKDAQSIDDVELIGDPDQPAITDDRLEDQRVHHPSDDAFEAAVRGAQAQFEGSPYFKRDPNSDYENRLKNAFSPNTTIYGAGGTLISGAGETPQSDPIRVQQAVEMRSLIIKQLIEELQGYVAAVEARANDNELADIRSHSLAFNLGLVFMTENDAPAWLTSHGEVGSIIQRKKRSSDHADSNPVKVRPFNTSLTSFETNPPQFQRVKQYTDANTIAITWDLVWPAATQASWSELDSQQQRPEHNLRHYLVRRRLLAGGEREIEYTIKPIEILNREVNQQNEDVIQRLRPRFQIVDHFNEETAEDQAALPARGQSYIYTITPVDVAGTPSLRPLTLIATRFANVPPLVPADAELVVKYHLDDKVFAAAGATSRTRKPDRIFAQWTSPSTAPQDVHVGVAKTQLVFRKEPTLPTGSFGLDNDNGSPRSQGLPTSNARILRTDIVVNLPMTRDPDADPNKISSEVSLDRNVLPDDWRPESWRVFIQTVSNRNVPSALVPVAIVLRFETDQSKEKARVVERRPSFLEWITEPLRLKALPPEDEAADDGFALVPMPSVDDPHLFDADLTQIIKYQKHPARLRCIRFQWNQGPSGDNAYPLALHAGYRLYEFDLDAHTAAALDYPDKDFWSKLRLGQKMEILSREEQLLTPRNTLTANQWEAWYPSTVQRLQYPAPDERSETKLSPWYSWRDSYLQWPDDASLRDPTNNEEVTGSYANFATISAANQTLKYEFLDGDKESHDAASNFLSLLAKLRPDQTKPQLRQPRYVKVSGSANPTDNGIKRLIAVDPENFTLTFAPNSFQSPDPEIPDPAISDPRILRGKMKTDGKTITTVDSTSLEIFSSGQVVKISNLKTNEHWIKKVITPDLLPAKNTLNVEPPFAGTVISDFQIDTVNIIVDASPFKSLHPFLLGLIEDLGSQQVPDDQAATVTVDLAPPPPVQPGDLKALLRNTSPESDPYGWNILKRMGLSLTFCLRNSRTGELLASTKDAQEIVKKVLARLTNDTPEYAPYIFVEYLFQPARSMKLADEPETWDEDDLLALIQISLRPTVQPLYKYARLSLGIDKQMFVGATINKAANTLSTTSKTDDLSAFAAATYIDISGAGDPGNNGKKKLVRADQTTLTLAAGSFTSDESTFSASVTSLVALTIDGELTIDKAANSLAPATAEFSALTPESFIEISGAKDAGNNGCRKLIKIADQKLVFDPGSFVSDEAKAALRLGPLVIDKTITGRFQLDKTKATLSSGSANLSAFAAASYLVISGAQNPANNGPKKIVKFEPTMLTFSPGAFAADEMDVPLVLSGLISKPIGPGDKLQLRINPGSTACTVVEQSGNPPPPRPDGGAPAPIELDANVTFPLAVTVPVTGDITLLFRSIDPGTITINENLHPSPLIELRDLFWSMPFFQPPLAEWQQKFTQDDDVKAAWEKFKRYLLRLNPADPGSANDPKIEFPKITNDGSSDDAVTELFVWLTRFFEASASVAKDDKPKGGPRLVAAYPRIASPVGVVPDAAGRLKFYQPVEDQWAHVYRYYILPHTRYDNLWQALAQSPILFPDPPAGAVPGLLDPRSKNLNALRVIDPPEDGGLDVVLDRIKPVAQPIVLFSGRLDLKTAPAVAAAPGKTWEVIVAKHSEQILIERNRTLARHLSYGHIAHTLLRRFAFTKSLDALRLILKDAYQFEISHVENSAAPDDFDPYSAPEHLNTRALDDYSLRTLEIPERIGVFGKGALVMQWEALPFFYEHRLLLVAQTSHCVSRVTDLVQRDFEYRAPVPSAQIEGDQSEKDPFRSLTLLIQLGSYWEALPVDAQQRWPFEDPSATTQPNDNDEKHLRKLSSLPDTEVAYQLVMETNTGMKEALVEFFFEPEPRPGDDPQKWFGYRPRIFNPKFSSHVVRFGPPVDQNSSSDPFHLQAQVYWRDTVKLSQRSFEVTGDFTRALENAQLIDAIPEFDFLPNKPRKGAALKDVDAFLKRWYAVRAISAPVKDDPPTLPADLRRKIDFLGPLVRWQGDSTPALLTALADWAKSSPPDVADVILDLKQQVENGSKQVTRVLPSDEVKVPASLTTRVSIGGFLIRARSPLSESDLEALNKQYPDLSDRDSLRKLFNDLADRQTIENFLATWATEEPISNRKAFSESQTWSERIEFPAPMSCSLVVTQKLDADQKRTLADLAGKSDLSLATAIRRLLELAVEVDAGDRALPISAEAGVGFEQLREIADESKLVLPTPANRKLKWLGSISEEQRQVIQRWLDVSSFAQTFKALLIASERATVSFSLDATQPLPAKKLPALLRQRLQIANAQIVWQDLLLRPEEETALGFLAQDQDYPDSFRKAVADLLIALTKPNPAGPAQIEVDVIESDWAPRPAKIDALKDVLLIGNGRIRFYGWMKRTEAEALRTDKSEPDRQSISRLFEESLRAGLQGGKLWIKARRGSAKPEQSLIKATL